MANSLTRAIPDWPAPDGERDGPHVVGVLPGEGVGPEVVGAALDVLAGAARAFDLEVEIREGGAIGVPAQQACGRALSPEVEAFCEQVFLDRGAILCGPGGARFVYDLRSRFDLYCKLTPVRPSAALSDAGAVRPEARESADLLVVRENSGGIYFGEWGFRGDGRAEAAFHRFEYDGRRVARILDVAVRASVHRQRRLCLVVKPGGLPSVSELWQRELENASSGRGIETSVLEVDNAAYQLIADARSFDVVVAPNLFGDILSDGAALLLGSRGLSFSGNFGPAGVGAYQTGHGAAGDLAGLDRANPLGQVASVAMLLRESFGREDAADAIEAAVEETVAAGFRTQDIAGPGSRVIGTREMGTRVADAVASATAGARP